MNRLHRGWLEQSGINVAAGAVVEISPLWALDADGVESRATAGLQVEQDVYFTT